MARLTGTITFVFTDIEGSTRKWDREPSAMAEALRRHNDLLKAIFTAHGGDLFKSLGDGFCIAFPAADKALQACVEAQCALARETWGLSEALRVRMALHSGVAETDDLDYYGPALNRTARIMNLGHGGQILLSSVARSLAADAGLEGVTFRSLGTIALAGLIRPEEVFQVGHPALSETFPPLRAAPEAAAGPPHNFGADERPFVGRESELAQLRERLLGGDQRLLTVTGIGGIGKTRLARRAALDCLGSFSDGVWLVECESLSSRDEIVAATLSALGVEWGEASSEEALVRDLAGKRILLLLDCFERLLEQAPLVGDLLRQCPGLQCLVTSRVLLELPWEFEFPLGPMALKKASGPTSDGVELFVQAARHADSRFQLTSRARPLVGALVKDLEGVPLAIVLAAGRLRHLALPELREQVRAHRWETLRRRPVGKDRHSNLLEVIEGSFLLLEERDRALAQALSVFVGGFFIEDALAVTDGSSEVIDGIARLRDHSLLTSQTVGERKRFKALDTVREYVASTTDERALAEYRRRHASHFASKASTLQRMFADGSWQAASSQLWLDAGNFRAAVRQAIHNADAPQIREFAKALARAYLEAGAQPDFKALTSEAERLARTSGDRHLLADIYGLWGAFARRTGKAEEARRHWRNRLDVLGEMGDVEGQADALLDLADYDFEMDRLEAARESLGAFAGLQPRLSEGPVLASGLLLGARLALRDGDADRARGDAEEARAMIADAGASDLTFYVKRSLAEIYRETGQPARAVEVSRELLADSLERNYVHHAVRSLFVLSDSLRASGDLVQAAQALAAAIAAPKSGFPRLREEARRRKAAFEGELGSRQLELAAQALGKAPWGESALRLSAAGG